jgi:hypothetical protein
MIMTDYFYKSTAVTTVGIVREFYVQKAALKAGLTTLGHLFGGDVAPMHNITDHFAGGVKLSTSRELDVHWCRPDEFGYRSLRQAAKPVKGTPKDERASIRAEHERLLTLWRDNCPARLDSHRYWDQLGVNTGNLLFCGGIKFELDGTAYFHLGFQINHAEHLSNTAAGKPSSGWIEGAVEILASEFQAARTSKLEGKRTVAHA